eukprot:COSAG02_NODE_23004_length_732_cov_81.290679_2_plen_81_part_00
MTWHQLEVVAAPPLRLCHSLWENAVCPAPRHTKARGGLPCVRRQSSEVSCGAGMSGRPCSALPDFLSCLHQAWSPRPFLQ